MAGVSKMVLIGNLGRDPETRFTPSGVMNVSFSMAVSRRWNDQSGQTQERTNWFRVTAWRRLAETLNNLAQEGALAKGRQVYVLGNFEAREYTDREGLLRTSLDVTADEVLLLGPRGDAGGPGAVSRSAAGMSDDDQETGSRDFDEVPF